MKGYPVEVKNEAQGDDPALAAKLWDLSEKSDGRSLRLFRCLIPQSIVPP